MKYPGLITVRTSSTRLPNKCLLPFGNGNVIEHIINRAKHSGLNPILCTSIDPSDDILEEISRNTNTPVYRGHLANKLMRWRDCCRFFNLEDFHSIDADDPFFDGDLMIKSIELLREGYDMVYPTKSSHRGSATVGFSLTTKIIDKACTGIDGKMDTEVMWPFIEKINGIKKITLPEKEENPYVARLTLDYEEDYWLLKSIERICGALASRDSIDAFLIKNPDFYKINWFRNSQWKENQESKEQRIANNDHTFSD
jgi:spore coat polysaccharide biosynthesis protein SpsF